MPWGDRERFLLTNFAEAPFFPTADAFRALIFGVGRNMLPTYNVHDS